MTSFEMMNLFLSRAQSRHREADEVSSESAFAALTADALENEQHAQVYALASIAESLAKIANGETAIRVRGPLSVFQADYAED